MNLIPGIARFFSGLSNAKSAGRVQTAQQAVQSAKRGGNAVAQERAARRLDAAERAHARNEYVGQQVTSLVDSIDQMTGGLIAMSRFQHSITVSVKGGPQASLRRCWFLCIAALFGRRRRGLTSLWAEAMNAQWDITGKSVTATLSYTTSTLTEPWTALSNTQSPFAMLQRGPDQVTIGSSWPAVWFTWQQQFNAGGGGINGGLAGANLAGGLLRVLAGGLQQMLLPKENEIKDPTLLHRYADSVLASPLPPYDRGEAVINPDTTLRGWFVKKGDNDFLQPTFTAHVQPHVLKPITHPLAELPVDLGFGTEAVPYTVQQPAELGTGVIYQKRGGVYGYLPKLPDDGRIITTGEKQDPRVQPVKPPVDGLSRGHLLTMVAAALASPGVLVEAPKNYKNNTQPLASQGLFVHAPNVAGVDPDDKFRFWRQRVEKVLKAIFDTLQDQSKYGLHTPRRVDNVRPPDSVDRQLGNDIYSQFGGTLVN